MIALLRIFDLVPGWVYAIAVALLLASSSVTTWRWLGGRDEVARLEVLHASAVETAGRCSKSVENLQRTAADRAKAARPVIAKAAAAAVVADQRADQILASAPSTPGDDCKSAQDQVYTWLQGRATTP